jgi:hypothetical protein
MFLYGYEGMEEVEKHSITKCNIALSALCETDNLNCLLGWAEELQTLRKQNQQCLCTVQCYLEVKPLLRKCQLHQFTVVYYVFLSNCVCRYSCPVCNGLIVGGCQLHAQSVYLCDRLKTRLHGLQFRCECLG